MDYTAKNCKLHKFATNTKRNFEIINHFRHAPSYNVHVHHFSAKSG